MAHEISARRNISVGTSIRAIRVLVDVSDGIDGTDITDISDIRGVPDLIDSDQQRLRDIVEQGRASQGSSPAKKPKLSNAGVDAVLAP